MPKIIVPFSFEDLPTAPPLSAQPVVRDEIDQVFAMLVGWDGSTRRLVRVSPTGMIRVGSARAKGVWDVVANTDGYLVSGANLGVSEVMIRSYPDNAGRVFVNIGTPAALNTGYPLFSGEWLSLSVNNLNSVHLYIEFDLEKVAVLYTE